jgi:HlyD family secretion protein
MSVSSRDNKASRKQRSATQRSMRRYQFLGMFVIVLLVVGLGGWAAVARISGAIIAEAIVVVESSSKNVQHLEGGIIESIEVREGDLVEAGDLLIRLDDTDTRANLEIVSGQLIELQSSQARLEAERDGSDEIVFSDEPEHAGGDPAGRRSRLGQEKIFSARKAALASQKDQLTRRIKQLEEEIGGLETQHAATLKQIGLAELELGNLQQLKKKGLVQANRVFALERDVARLQGTQGRLVADSARARGRIGETRLQIIQIDQEGLKQVLEELRDVQTRIAELLERRRQAQSRLARTDIFAPRSGVVHQLAVHTRGGVIGAGASLMMIVPQEDVLVLEARIDPQDIDHVRIGQAALVRFPVFDLRITPTLDGRVTRISPDLTPGTSGMPSYYAARIELDEGEIENLGDQRLKPGMPAESFVQTGSRTALSYLLKPLTDQISRAFREG